MPPTTDAIATLPGLVAARMLDGPLAALAWLMVERGIPILVAGGDEAAGLALIDALTGALPARRRPDATAPGSPGGLVRVAGVLARDTPPGVLRAALGTTTARGGLAALVGAPDLEGVLDVLARQGLTNDEASFLGVVLVVEQRPEAGGGPRVVAAHYLRPLGLDAGGHPRRQRPAVLATWDSRDDRWEDFAWGILPDLAQRCRMRAGDFDAERQRRAAALDDLVGRDLLDPGSLSAAAQRLSLEQAPRD
jgi:hypothetical protein